MVVLLWVLSSFDATKQRCIEKPTRRYRRHAPEDFIVPALGIVVVGTAFVCFRFTLAGEVTVCRLD